MSKKYFLSGSVFATALKCPGSLHFTVTANPFEKRNKNADAGTAKHDEIENDLSLVERFLPSSWNLNEMQATGRLSVEMKLSGSYKTLTIGGKADLLAVDSGTLYIYDWKTGWQDVSEMEPEQLLLYGYMALNIRFVKNIENVHLSYINPDSGTSNGWRMTPAELVSTVEKHFENILKGIAKPGEKALVAGQQCRYCKNQTVCPRLKKLLTGYANPKFRDVLTENWTDEEIGLLPVAEKIIKSVKEDIKNRIDAGMQQSGFEVTRQAGTRSFIYGVDSVEVAARLGTDPIAVTKTDLLSPAQLEKDFDISCLSDLIVQPSNRFLRAKKKEVEKVAKKASKKTAKKTTGKKVNRLSNHND